VHRERILLYAQSAARGPQLWRPAADFSWSQHIHSYGRSSLRTLGRCSSHNISIYSSTIPRTDVFLIEVSLRTLLLPHKLIPRIDCHKYSPESCQLPLPVILLELLFSRMVSRSSSWKNHLIREQLHSGPSYQHRRQTMHSSCDIQISSLCCVCEPCTRPLNCHLELRSRSINHGRQLFASFTQYPEPS
jgi:hypothetical protein